LALRRLQGIRIVLDAAVVCEAPHTVYVFTGVVVFGRGQAEGRGPLANERINAMSDTTIGFDQTEEEIILAFDVSDEVLESAAGMESEKAGNYTLALCTWLTGCPI
jgi:predicted house-cleaning NTP pyrophosphatase (Maf/HAM1 superfamily)